MPKNIVIYGLEATGKSSITAAALSRLCSSSASPGLEPDGLDDREEGLQYAVVKSAECITGRHLLETIVGSIAHAIGWKGAVHRCENLSQLAVEIARLLDGSSHKLNADGNSNFFLVLNGIDRQRDAPPTLLPALARMGEVVSDHL